MARVFNGTSDMLRANWSQPGGWGDRSVAMWFNADTLQDKWIHSTWGSGNYYSGFYIMSTGYVRAYWRGADTRFQTSTNTYTAGSWNLIGGAWGYKRLYDVCLNGTCVTGNIYSNGAAPSILSIGGYYSASSLLDGKLAWAAMWNARLDADDWLSLSAGASPLLVRPDDLSYFQPLGGIYGEHDYDIVGGELVTVYSGAPTFDDDAPAGLIHPVTARWAASGGGLPKSLWVPRKTSIIGGGVV